VTATNLDNYLFEQEAWIGAFNLLKKEHREHRKQGSSWLKNIQSHSRFSFVSFVRFRFMGRWLLNNGERFALTAGRQRSCRRRQPNGSAQHIAPNKLRGS
jgi:hypothetical protein